MKDYSNCNLIEKVWRSRWRVLTPIVAFSLYRNSIKEYVKNCKHWILEYDECISIAKGLTDCRMGRYKNWD